jgi:hypothetical protein
MRINNGGDTSAKRLTQGERRAQAKRFTPGTCLVLALLLAATLLSGCSHAIVEEIVQRGAEYNLAYRPSEGYSSNSSTSTEASVQAGTDLGLEGLRESYDDTSDDQSVTVMMYFIGSDLETYDGAASNDIKEMLRAELGDNINVVIETGGAQSWHFSEYIDTRTPQRWFVEDQHLTLAGMGSQRSMTEPEELTDFISWAAAAYPADRNILILWDHGGGTVTGYGSDEVYPFSDPLSLLELRDAMLASGVQFNFVGYDACLLGTLEMAWAMEPVADYLIGSEEYEPSLGWSYTGFLTELSANPSISTPELAETIVGDFIDDCTAYGTDDLTLSCVDLREVNHVYEQLDHYLEQVRTAIEQDNARYSDFSRARSSAKEFADASRDQVDIIDLVSRTDFEGAEELVAAVDSCVKYRGSAGITGANGLAMYFPYSDMSDYHTTVDMLRELGFVEPLDFYEFSVALMSQSGPASETDTTVPVEQQVGEQQPGEQQPGEGEAGEAEGGSAGEESGATEQEGTTSSEGGGVVGLDGQTTWSQILELLQNHGTPGELEELLESFTYEETVSTTAVDETGEIPLSQTDAGYELSLSEDQWNSVSSMDLVAVLVREDDMLYLGCDKPFAYTDAGNPLITTDGSWLGIDGTPVMFESHPVQLRDDYYYYSGSVYATLNGRTPIVIEVAWPLLDGARQPVDGSPNVATVLGYRLSDENTSGVGRGYHQFMPGDVVSFDIERYDDDGNFVDYVTIGPSYTVRSQAAMTFSYIDLYGYAGTNEIACWGRVVDIYQNVVNTETVWE